MTTYVPKIGLEIHVELKTKTKMFCYSLNDPNEKHPNINICPICMGHPGTLPVINQEAVKKVIMVGLALNGKVQEFSQFDRKNYFYPDLPKGYQISQYQYPLVKGGLLEIDDRKIRIRRIHLEEDTGRLIHERTEINTSLVDFNRAGVSLMELVTEPDLQSGEEVKKFGEELQLILRYLGVSDADMEKGQLRVEVNVSLQNAADEKKPGDGKLGTKVEIKNINSFKFAADAADYEIKRQGAILDRGEKIKHETRGWDETKKETLSQRHKEEAHDYRYFPEPDLPPLEISPELVGEVYASIPELPQAKRTRFTKEFGLEQKIIENLVRDKPLADYFENVISEINQHDKETLEKPKKSLQKTTAAFLTGDFLHILRKVSTSVSETLITPSYFAKLVLFFAEDKISGPAAKQILEEMFRTGENPEDVINKFGLWQLSNEADLENLARHIVSENPKAAADYRQGKTSSLQFLIGQVMKDSQGKANPKVLQEIIKKVLDEN